MSPGVTVLAGIARVFNIELARAPLDSLLVLLYTIFIMSSRLFIASAALTAVVGASAFVAVSTANTNHHVAGSAAVPGAGASHGASATSAIVAAHANQRVAQWSQNGVVSAALPGASASSAFSAAAAGPTSSTPTLVSVRGGAHVLAQGAQKAVPVAVNEDQAMQAIFKGGMWLPNASGGREYAKYDHHLIHDGDWTWVGKVQTTHGLQS